MTGALAQTMPMFTSGLCWKMRVVSLVILLGGGGGFFFS